MGQGLGPVQKAVLEVLGRASKDLTLEEVTIAVYAKLGKRSGYGGWKNRAGVPLEQHYAAVRRALSTLPEVKTGVEVES